MINLSASCVSRLGKGILLLGASGSGKSDLALRLIDRGALLVSDDQVMVNASDGILTATCPPLIQGFLEMRGIGIIKLPHIESTPLSIAVSLCARDAQERLPEPQHYECLGISIPLITVDARDASAPARVEFALQALLTGNVRSGALA